MSYTSVPALPSPIYQALSELHLGLYHFPHLEGPASCLACSILPDTEWSLPFPEAMVPQSMA